MQYKQTLLPALLVASAFVGTGNSAWADDDDAEGGIGINYFSRLSAQVSSVEVAPETDDAGNFVSNDYDSSIPIKVAYDVAGLFLPSINGNKHGFEGHMSVTLNPFDFDFWGGTAVTLLSVGDGGIGTLRLRGGFGVGFSYNHAYAYLKAQAATVIIPEVASVEASVFWIPNEASNAWGDRPGDFEEQRRRASLYWNLGEDSKTLEFYAESIDRQRGGHGEDFVGNPDDFNMRDPTDDMKGLGLGASLILDFD